MSPIDPGLATHMYAPTSTRNNGTRRDLVSHDFGPDRTEQTDRKSPKRKRMKKQQLERVRLQAKADSPGVPPNTCPYIDLVQNMITDLQGAYDRLRERGEHNPVVDDISKQATDLLEYIRRNNETLRDNSAYWYGQYKQQLKRK